MTTQNPTLTQRLRAIQDRLTALGFRDLRLAAPDAAKGEDLAALLEAYLDGQTDPMPPVGDSVRHGTKDQNCDCPNGSYSKKHRADCPLREALTSNQCSCHYQSADLCKYHGPLLKQGTTPQNNPTDAALIQLASQYDQGSGSTYEFDSTTMLRLLRESREMRPVETQPDAANQKLQTRLREIAESLLCREGSGHYCPNCCNSTFDAAMSLKLLADQIGTPVETSGLKCAHCNGSGKETQHYDEANGGWSPERACQTCNGSGRIHTVEQYLKTLPADWHQDSSLKTWFPITDEEFHQVRPRADAYDRVCQQLGIKNDIIGYVERYKQALQRANGFLIMNNLEPVKLEYSSVEPKAPIARKLCPHGAAEDEVCPQCLGAPSDNPDDEITSVNGSEERT